MSRRKQSRPMKRPLEDEEQEQLDEKTGSGTKNIRLDQPSTSKATSPSVVGLPSNDVQAPSTNALALLEKSLKKFEPSNRSSVPNGKSTASGSLGALFNCIGKISSSKPDGVASILKCLQCGAGFPVMEQLVRHMQETKHFSNLPKTYSNVMQLNHEKVYSNPTKPHPTQSLKLACLKCGEIPKDMDKHLRDVHIIKRRSDWLRNVQVMATGKTPPAVGLPPAVLQSPHIKQIMSIINAVDRHK